MTFLQPFILWGLPLLLIPVIIHLVNRLRHRPQPWAAMRFLRAANRSAVSQAKLRQFVVLLMRVLAVTALVFFLSRPLAGGWLGWALSPRPEVVVLVLDRSASMELRTGARILSLRQQALELWTEALRPFQRSRLVLIDSGTEVPHELPNLSALMQPTFTGPTDGRADMPLLLQRAFSYLTESKSGAAEVWIASDLQESNWSPRDNQWERIVAQFAALPQKVRFRLLTFEGADNVSVSLVDALRRSRDNKNRSLAVTVDLEQAVATERTAAIKWQLGGASSQAEVPLSGQALRWRNNFPLPAGDQPGWGTIEVDADGNVADNKVYFAYEPERAPEALIVSSAIKLAAPLQLAASDLSRAPLQLAKVVAPEGFMTTPLTNTALVVWQSYTLPTNIASMLEGFTNSGGVVLFLPESAPAGPPFLGVSFSAVVPAVTNGLMSVTKWNELEGPFAKTEEGFGVPLNTLEVYRRAGISGTAAILASFSDGAPFLARKAIGKGEVYFCATAVDPNWSSLSDGAVLVPMLQRMLSQGSKRLNSAVNTECTDWRFQEGSELKAVEPSTARDPKVDAGVYSLGGRFVAVNRPLIENNVTRAPEAAIRALFANVPFQMHQERASGNDRLQGEVWRLFVTLMLIFLIVEGLLILPSKQPASERRVVSSTPSAATA